jgi:hypothetical protein
MEELLNTYLRSLGKSLTGQYIYRLVWSDKILENRYGTYNDFTESGLFIRSVTETRLVPKYNYIKDRWILEKWADGSLTRNKETPDASNGDYIPVYVFEDGKGNYLHPTRKVLEFLINSLNGRVRKDLEPDEKYIEEKETQSIYESLDDHPSWFKTSGESRNAVAYTKELKDVN